MLRLLMITGAVLAATPALAQEKPLDASDAAAFVGQLGEMGYAPEALAMQEDHPYTIIKVDDRKFVLTFGGCTGKKDCSYVTLVGAFTDVNNPPADWVSKENGDFDLIKVWLNDNGGLIYSTTAVIQGWPRANFRSFTRLLYDSGTQLAKDALDAKLIK